MPRPRRGGRASDEVRRPLEGVFPSKLTSDRPYRKGRSFEEAFGEVEKYAGAQFDPQLVEVMLSIPRACWLEAKSNTLRRLRPPTIH